MGIGAGMVVGVGMICTIRSVGAVVLASGGSRQRDLGSVGVPAAVRAVVSIRVISTVRTVVGVSAGTIAVVVRVVPSRLLI